jgi:hypothetical protein
MIDELRTLLDKLDAEIRANKELIRMMEQWMLLAKIELDKNRT